MMVPASSGTLAGRTAKVSVELNETVFVIVGTRFQRASTALIVKSNGVATARAEAVPVLPVAVPGAAVSPGARICNLVKAPAVVVSSKGDGVVTLPVDARTCTA